MTLRNNRSAFSLVELSIVLVILGLLTGGILAGQSLIRASEMRAVSSEYQRYAAAIGSFRDKYFALPGDMTNAVTFWTADAACPSVVATATVNVCNGNGDGQILATAATSNEIFGFWEHLARAGLVEGSYNGAPNSATATATVTNIGTNIPRGKLSQSGWSAMYIGTIAVTPTTTYFEGAYGNAFLFGGGTDATLPTEVLKPEEAWNVDTKMDDGKPATGAVVGLERDALAAANAAGCSNPVAAATTLAASTYALDQGGVNCALIFQTGY